MTERLFLTMPEVAAALGVSKPRVYQLASEGRIPCIRDGRRMRVPREAFDRWIAAQVDEALANVTQPPP